MSNQNLRFFAYVLLIQVLMLISTFFNIPIVRQVLAFFFFTIIPGFLFLKIFRIKRPYVAETFLLSIGLSIAFLMIIGFLLNELGSVNLISKPLSTEVLTIVVNLAIFLMSTINYFRNKDSDILNIKSLKPLPFLTCYILPILSVIGILSILYFNSNILFIIILLVIPAILALSVISSKIASKISLYYPLIVFSIVLCLVLSQSLISGYMYGDDIQNEFDTLMATKNASYWNPLNNSYVQQSSDNSMLSITILPTVLSNLLNIDPGWILKIIFPIFFSLISLGLYQLYRRHFSERTAFISVIFFVANYAFFVVVLTNAKQMIGELFFVILFLILFSESAINKMNEWIILIVALFGLVVSHYSMVYIFLFFVLLAWAGGKFLRRRTVAAISASFVVLSCTFTFIWYGLVLQDPYGPLRKFAGAIGMTFSGFISEFFSPTSRGGDVGAALGLVNRPSVLHYAGTFFYDLTILLILLGFVLLLFKWKNGKFDTTFFSIITLSVVVLFSAVVIPNFADQLGLGRLYHILLMFLSPLFVLGIEALVVAISHFRILRRTPTLKDEQKKSIYGLLLTLVILTAFFLFQTGFIYEVTGDSDPSSIVLSRDKVANSTNLINENDVFSARWLSRYGKIDDLWTFADSVSLFHVLTSYSTIDRSMIILLSNNTDKWIADGTYVRHENSLFPNLNTTYIYLSKFNVIHGIIYWDPGENMNFNASQIPIINNNDVVFVNRIYSNGASEILYREP